MNIIVDKGEEEVEEDVSALRGRKVRRESGGERSEPKQKPRQLPTFQETIENKNSMLAPPKSMR